MSDLAAKTILLTRAQDDAAAWAQELEARGARVLHLPCIECQTIDDPGRADALVAALSDADWLAVSSRRGVAAVAELAPGALPDSVRVAAVGPATAAAAREQWGRCELVSADPSAKGLGESLRDRLAEDGQLDSARVVLALADRADRGIERVLEKHGTWVTRLSVYRTRPVAPSGRPRDLSSMAIDAVFLASPSAAQGLVNQMRLPPDLPVFTIGASTSQTARGLGIPIRGEARQPSLDGLVDALLAQAAPPTPDAP